MKNLSVFSIWFFIMLFAVVAFGRDFSESECPVVGNTESGIYHVKGCPNYEQMLAQNKHSDNRKCFKSRGEADTNNYRIAKNCRKEVYQ
jgi:hypothetical protein